MPVDELVQEVIAHRNEGLACLAALSPAAVRRMVFRGGPAAADDTIHNLITVVAAARAAVARAGAEPVELPASLGARPNGNASRRRPELERLPIGHGSAG